MNAHVCIINPALLSVQVILKIAFYLHSSTFNIKVLKVHFALSIKHSVLKVLKVLKVLSTKHSTLSTQQSTPFKATTACSIHNWLD